MGRYYAKAGCRSDGEQRTSIGDRWVEQAVIEIDKLAGVTAATMTSYDLSVDQTLPMLFDDGDLDRAVAARGLIQPSSVLESYEVIGTGISLWINYKDANSRYPTLMPAAMRINPDRAGPLRAHVEAVKAIYHQFEEVKAVLRWMNRNATPGAIRYYWPTALKLCPQSPAMQEVSASVPTRFTTPQNISSYLEIIKTSATTMASAAMLPSTAQPRAKKAMWLTFGSKEVPVGLQQHASYKTDIISFNI